MPEIPVLYADGFEFTSSPFGCLLRFGTRMQIPGQGGAPGQAFVEQVRLGMSLEHLKLMVTILVREIQRSEVATGQKIEFPDQLLQDLKISPSEFAAFWGLPPKAPVSSTILTTSALTLAPR